MNRIAVLLVMAACSVFAQTNGVARPFVATSVSIVPVRQDTSAVGKARERGKLRNRINRVRLKRKDGGEREIPLMFDNMPQDLKSSKRKAGK